MVTAQRPEEFLAGDESAGRALPHANVVVETDGRVAVAGAGLFRGYWPEARAEADGRWRSDDLGEIDAAGRLRVLGRADALIISGGEKVNPAEVEAVVREAAGAAWADVAVVGVPHAEWGEEVVALFVSGTAGGDTEARVRARVAEGLAAAVPAGVSSDMGSSSWVPQRRMFKRQNKGRIRRGAGGAAWGRFPSRA
jgi:O-succinylbenzoic acid--CoA ligase